MNDLRSQLHILQAKTIKHAKKSNCNGDDSRLIKDCADCFLNAAACIEWLEKEFPEEYKGSIKEG